MTNDTTQDNRDDLQWKIEQLTGIEANQCRKARIQRNHVACCVFVWSSLSRLAKTLGKTMYQLKQGLLDAYLCEQPKYPALRFA